jgi:hypothetical protein
MCQWNQRAGGSVVAPSAPSAPDIAIASDQTNVIVTWTNGATPGTTNELWKSTDGITFALFASVAGGLTQKADATGMAAGNIWYYKVRACNGLSCSAFTSVVSASFNFTSGPAVSISLPTLIREFGDFVASGIAITSLSLPALKTVLGLLNFGGDIFLTSVTLTSLISVGNTIEFNSCTALTSISFPALTSIHSLDGDSSTSLVSVNIGTANFVDGGVLDLSNCALNAASVNAVLARGVASAPVLHTYDFELNLGTNAAPSGQGVADKATLIVAGNVVNTN